MIESQSYTQDKVTGSSKIKEIAQLMKLRLTSLVVISAGLGYGLAVTSSGFSWFALVILSIGGVLVTGASNGFNQIIERDSDALMKRTADRPIPKQRLSVTEALIWCTLLGVIGIFLIWYFLNPLSGILAALALVMYVAVYTPLKKVTPWAVFVGAFPGAIPPMLGWVAATGSFGLEPGILFAVQFMWQFPHFWSIAWVSDADYQKGGFYLLPRKGGKIKQNAFTILLYSLFMIPVGLLPWSVQITGNISAVLAVLLGCWLSYKAFKLLRSCEDKDARKLMFTTFYYLPLLLISYVIDKI